MFLRKVAKVAAASAYWRAGTMSTRTVEWVRDSIQRFKKRASVLQRRPLLDEEDDNEDVQELIALENTIARWEIALQFLELYERQPHVDHDAKAVWDLLSARFPWSGPAENDEELTEIAVSAMTVGGPATYELMREFVYLQNRGPFGYYLLPHQFMSTVVRLGLMDRSSLKLDAARPAPTTAAGQ
jgi:hypothetical protein